jgi:hypothetical protein
MLVEGRQFFQCEKTQQKIILKLMQNKILTKIEGALITDASTADEKYVGQLCSGVVMKDDCTDVGAAGSATQGSVLK